MNHQSSPRKDPWSSVKCGKVSFPISGHEPCPRSAQIGRQGDQLLTDHHNRSTMISIRNRSDLHFAPSLRMTPGQEVTSFDKKGDRFAGHIIIISGN